MDDLRDRLANRVQLTSDGHKSYLEASDRHWEIGDIIAPAEAEEAKKDRT